MKKFKLIIVPSSDDEKLFENVSEYDAALKIIEGDEGIMSKELSFDSENEREIFLQGYYAGIGFLGEGLAWKKDETGEKVFLYGPEDEGRTFARKCDITGEGMNEGWCIGGGAMYVKYEMDMIKYAKQEWGQTLQEAFDESEENGGDDFYHTTWEDEDEHQYVVQNGILVEIDY